MIETLDYFTIITQYSTCFKDKDKFEHSLSSIVGWEIRKNNPDFRGFTRGLDIGI
jgi:hypothetical protein